MLLKDHTLHQTSRTCTLLHMISAASLFRCCAASQCAERPHRDGDWGICWKYGGRLLEGEGLEGAASYQAGLGHDTSDPAQQSASWLHQGVLGLRTLLACKANVTNAVWPQPVHMILQYKSCPSDKLLILHLTAPNAAAYSRGEHHISQRLDADWADQSAHF